MTTAQKKPRILFVDDEEFILNSLRRNLRDMEDEWEMTFTESGSTAIELLDKYPFDAVVTDMEMPVVQGWRLLRHIGEKHPAVVKIMLTGNCDMFTALMQVPGHFDYLTKPVNVDALKLLILRRLSEPPQEELPPQAMRDTH